MVSAQLANLRTVCRTEAANRLVGCMKRCQRAHSQRHGSHRLTSGYTARKDLCLPINQVRTRGQHVREEDNPETQLTLAFTGACGDEADRNGGSRGSGAAKRVKERIASARTYCEINAVLPRKVDICCSAERNLAGDQRLRAGSGVAVAMVSSCGTRTRV